MNSPSRQKASDDWPICSKIAFTLICCTPAALLVAGIRTVESGASPVFFSIGILMLMAVTLNAFWLSVRGRSVASWGVLAYGSWMTIPILMLLYWLWEGQDRLEFVISATPILASGILFFILIGIRAALQGQWTHVLLWWLISIVPIWFLLLCISSG